MESVDMPRKIDLRFPVFGTEIPADHGFRLFSAISGIVPEIHDDEGIGIHSINGTLSGNRCLTLTRRSFLAIRLEVERVRHLMRLAGKVLQIGRARVGVGVPQAWALAPAERLYSRLVVIKGFMKPDTFLEAARTQLAELGVEGEVSLVAQPDAQAVNQERRGGTRSPWLRRTVEIHGRRIVGFALRVEGLSPRDSIRLQEEGIGGRRRFGCGLFIPARSG